MQKENKTRSEKLGAGEKIGYASGDFACCLIWQAVSVYLLYYFSNAAGVDSSTAIRIISISRIIDAVTDVLMGFIIDKTKTRFGHVRPYLLTMGLPLAISTVMLFSVPAGFPQAGKLLWVAIWYNMVTSVFYTALNVPYSSMLSFLSDDSEERSRLSLIRLVFAFSAMVVLNLIMFRLVRGLGNGQLSDQHGWTMAICIISGAAFLLTLVTFFSTRERVSPVEDEDPKARSASNGAHLKAILGNRYLLLLYTASMLTFVISALTSNAAAYYAQYILGNVDHVGILNNATMVIQILFMLFITPVLLRYFSKSFLYTFANAFCIFCYLATGIFSRNMPTVLIMNALKGAAFSLMTPLMFAMVADAIDYGEWKTGISVAGLGNAALQSFGKIGLALGTAALGVALDLGGFDATAQTQAASGMRALVQGYAWLPAILSAVIVFIMLHYHLDKIYPDISKELKERRLAHNQEK